MKKLPELVRRQRAVENTERRFTDKPFRLGMTDCATLAVFHLRRFGWKPPRFEKYKTEMEAARTLKALNARSLADVLDAMGLQRRAPAEALLGDLYFMPGTGAVGTVTIALGNGAMKGFHEDHSGLVTMRSDMIITAWNVVP